MLPVRESLSPEVSTTVSATSTTPAWVKGMVGSSSVVTCPSIVHSTESSPSAMQCVSTSKPTSIGTFSPSGGVVAKRASSPSHGAGGSTNSVCHSGAKRLRNVVK